MKEIEALNGIDLKAVPRSVWVELCKSAIELAIQSEQIKRPSAATDDRDSGQSPRKDTQ